VLKRALLAAALAALPLAPAGAQEPRDCARCHSSREFLLQAASGRNPAASLVVTREHLAGGPHARVACGECHAGVQTYPHDTATARTVLCRTCHAAVDSLWRRGVHGPRADTTAATCAACHGGHDIARKGFLPTAAGRQLMRDACRNCHKEQVASATRDVHADSIPCTACHGAHDMPRVPDRRTRFIDVALARRCSGCHAKEAASYWKDVHGRTATGQATGALPLGEGAAATCISCHGEHGIRPARDASWRFAVADACISCHQDAGVTFRDSYHGQASRVGSTKAAECADCHTPHHVLPAADTASSVSGAHRLATCQHCHADAKAGFLGYRPHANPMTPADSPLLFWVWAFMTTALVGTMVVWGIHTVLWYRRTLSDRRARGRGEPRHLGEPLDAALRGRGPFVWRFSLIFRVIHAMIVVTFFALVLTGLPLRFGCTVWAGPLARLMGHTASITHRVAGTFVFVYFAIYFVYVAIRLAKARERRHMLLGPDAIILNLQDARDAIAMVKWFVGRGPKPRFGRYNYMEKFDYFAELWGVGAIGFSGLMLWQPEFFSHFFPGILFNVAIIIHSYEAMIATAFIFIVHFFNVHLRPEKWPLDAVMLHGRASMDYMEEEHPLLAERLREQWRGAVPSERAVTDALAPTPPPWLSTVAAVTGLALLAVGIGLILLILWGSVC
jgi:cytochrome b subunit of formate dehydrogenase